VSVKYQLPCACGQCILIEPRQAGESVTCECGAVLQAPTMLKMSTLETAVEERSVAPSKARHWGTGERMVLLGAVLLAAAAGLAILAVFWLRPVSYYEAVGPERIRASYQQLTPWKSWQAWERMKVGIDPRPDRRYAAQSRNYLSALGAAAVLAIVGTGLLAQGIRTARGTRRRNR
jgi:hypothetical protein